MEKKQFREERTVKKLMKRAISSGHGGKRTSEALIKNTDKMKVVLEKRKIKCGSYMQEYGWLTKGGVGLWLSMG